jgi:hypothetical protein
MCLRKWAQWRLRENRWFKLHDLLQAMAAAMAVVVYTLLLRQRM